MQGYIELYAISCNQLSDRGSGMYMMDVCTYVGLSSWVRTVVS